MASQLQVRDKSAWMGREFRNDNSWIATLTANQVAELSESGRQVHRTRARGHRSEARRLQVEVDGAADRRMGRGNQQRARLCAGQRFAPRPSWATRKCAPSSGASAFIWARRFRRTRTARCSARCTTRASRWARAACAATAPTSGSCFTPTAPTSSASCASARRRAGDSPAS